MSELDKNTRSTKPIIEVDKRHWSPRISILSPQRTYEERARNFIGMMNTEANKGVIKCFLIELQRVWESEKLKEYPVWPKRHWSEAQIEELKYINKLRADLVAAERIVAQLL